ncbi:hypothetical protein Y032_0435g1411 [Ancylostoma ceylanicum]|uniref:Uncharacterized protein n=1 Tax=Ancylostoma ceylanicum TaxID=53326 RepID=A0A016WZG4_9BILA|nr:hypothetical protein Y032_0435g1411 [Ancylostoma ceylanicum]
MRNATFIATMLALVCAQDDDLKCNYPPTGDELVESAVPIETYRTSGEDFIRPTWCITHCKDRKSLKAAMTFQPSNGNATTFSVISHRLSEGKRVFKVVGASGPTDNRELSFISMLAQQHCLTLSIVPVFCMDENVAAIADSVFKKYNDIEQISEALNYYINKPGWAYLVYQMMPGPSIINTDNVHIDPNFCMKNYEKFVRGRTVEFQLFAGLIKYK